MGRERTSGVELGEELLRSVVLAHLYNKSSQNERIEGKETGPRVTWQDGVL